MYNYYNNYNNYNSNNYYYSGQMVHYETLPSDLIQRPAVCRLQDTTGTGLLLQLMKLLQQVLLIVVMLM